MISAQNDSVRYLDISESCGNVKLYHSLRSQILDLLPQSIYSPSKESVDGFLSECISSHKSGAEKKLCFAALDDLNHVLGFVQFRSFASDADLDFVLVSSHCRGRGIAKLLLQNSFLFLKSNGVARIILEVGAGNSAAKRLYVSLGFMEVSLRKNYYRSGEDALVMELLI
jgi:ribosomal-protein-alanine N-acetyltransferase